MERDRQTSWQEAETEKMSVGGEDVEEEEREKNILICYNFVSPEI